MKTVMVGNVRAKGTPVLAVTVEFVDGERMDLYPCPALPITATDADVIANLSQCVYPAHWGDCTVSRIVSRRTAYALSLS